MNFNILQMDEELAEEYIYLMFGSQKSYQPFIKVSHFPLPTHISQVA